MRNLLSSGFSRLWRSKLLYLGTLAVAASVAYTLINNLYYKSLWGLTDLTATNLIFAGVEVLPVAIAALVALFIGTDHGDHTLRNKLIVGHGRAAVYFSNLIVCTAAALLMYAVGSGVVIAIGAPLLGGFSGTAHVLLLQILSSLLSVAALTALLVLPATLIPGRAVSVLTVLLLALALTLLVTPVLSSVLDVPETIGGFELTYGDGTTQWVEEKPNPEYLTGFKRQTVQFLHEFLPTGQLTEYGKEEARLPDGFWRLPLYAVLSLVASTATGIAIFKRQNLK